MSKKLQWELGPFNLLQTPRARYEDKKDDPYVSCGTLMAVIHNCWIRALNALYQAAPYVPKEDVDNFVGYAWSVCLGVKKHHDEEEEFTFPLLEEMTGIEGLMQSNVVQHRAFETGLEEFASYISSLMRFEPNEKFSSDKFRELIDAFREPLQTHLEDEIATLMELKKYPNCNVTEFQKRAHEQAMAHMKLTDLWDHLPVLMLNHDMTYEGGVHGMFPELPVVMSVLVRRVATCYHWGYWKYASCDTAQRPKSLPVRS